MNMLCPGARSRAPLLSEVVCLGLVLAGLAGCGPTQKEEVTDPFTRTGLALRAGIDEHSDVRAMRFSLSRISCSGEPVEPFSVMVDKSGSQ
jgi:hypothetical protein